MGCSATKEINSNGVVKCGCKCHEIKKTQPQPAKVELEQFVDDPRVPLTGRQKFGLGKSWKAISRNISQAGMLMFLSLFEKHDIVKEFFIKTFKVDPDSTLADFAENKKLQGHVAAIMLTIDEAITTLNDADQVIDTLTHIGATHVRFSGFKPEWFLLIKEPFLVAVKDTLGERYTASMESNYRKAIRFILETLIKGYEKASMEANGQG